MGEEICDEIWAEIVKAKILNQSRVLDLNGHPEEAQMLISYSDEIVPGDSTNREGHAAKVYSNALFGKDFSRRDENSINSALNYGYAILLSVVNRSITATGYSTMIGIFHSNNQNIFNLGSDLMEPIRPVIDEKVISMNFVEFGPEQKKILLNVLNTIMTVDGKRNYFLNAVGIYVQSFFNAMEERNPKALKFAEGTWSEGENLESDGVL